MNCKRKEKNLDRCNCSYDGCPRKGVCCECVHYHREKNEIPACFFSEEAEKTYDRSIDKFIEDYQSS